MSLFVSYSRDDSVWVKELVRELRDSGIYTVWMDTSWKIQHCVMAQLHYGEQPKDNHA